MCALVAGFSVVVKQHLEDYPFHILITSIRGKVCSTIFTVFIFLPSFTTLFIFFLHCTSNLVIACIPSLNTDVTLHCHYKWNHPVNTQWQLEWITVLSVWCLRWMVLFALFPSETGWNNRRSSRKFCTHFILPRIFEVCWAIAELFVELLLNCLSRHKIDSRIPVATVSAVSFRLVSAIGILKQKTVMQSTGAVLPVTRSPQDSDIKISPNPLVAQQRRELANRLIEQELTQHLSANNKEQQAPEQQKLEQPKEQIVDEIQDHLSWLSTQCSTGELQF